MTFHVFDALRLPEPGCGKNVIMIIRHAEKPAGSGHPKGVGPEGEHDKHSLAVNGWLRAGALVGLFAPSRGNPPAGLHRPDTVYHEARSKRSAQTVTPLAARLELDVIQRYGPGDEAALAAELTGRPGVKLVSWKHVSISKIIENLGDITPTPPKHWPRDRYDVVWTLTRNGYGWRFAQRPQMLLSGDLPSPITDPAPPAVPAA